MRKKSPVCNADIDRTNVELKRIELERDRESDRARVFRQAWDALEGAPDALDKRVDLAVAYLGGRKP